MFSIKKSSFFLILAFAFSGVINASEKCVNLICIRDCIDTKLNPTTVKIF